jgi:hypothetical protein
MMIVIIMIVMYANVAKDDRVCRGRGCAGDKDGGGGGGWKRE